MLIDKSEFLNMLILPVALCHKSKETLSLPHAPQSCLFVSSVCFSPQINCGLV